MHETHQLHDLEVQESKAKKNICSVKFYGTPYPTMQNLLTKRKRTKTSVAQANAKVTFHAIMSLWVTSNLSTLYFKLMTFPIHPVGRLAQDHGSFPLVRACNNTFLTRYRVNQFYKMSCSLNCSIEISRMHWHFENWDDMKHEPRNFGQQKLFC